MTISSRGTLLGTNSASCVNGSFTFDRVQIVGLGGTTFILTATIDSHAIAPLLTTKVTLLPRCYPGSFFSLRGAISVCQTCPFSSYNFDGVNCLPCPTDAVNCSSNLATGERLQGNMYVSRATEEWILYPCFLAKRSKRVPRRVLLVARRGDNLLNRRPVYSRLQRSSLRAMRMQQKLLLFEQITGAVAHFARPASGQRQSQ